MVGFKSSHSQEYYIAIAKLFFDMDNDQEDFQSDDVAVVLRDYEDFKFSHAILYYIKSRDEGLFMDVYNGKKSSAAWSIIAGWEACRSYFAFLENIKPSLKAEDSGFETIGEA